MLVDTHVHIDPDTDEPVEMLLAQMQLNKVDKATLVKRITSADNSYIIDCKRRYPDRFSVVCCVEVDSAHAISDLERWRGDGAQGLRIKNTDRSPGSDPFAIWRKAQELGMAVSVGGEARVFASSEFAGLVKELPDLKFVLEHLAGMGLFVIGQILSATSTRRPPPTDADYCGALKLAAFPNTFLKFGGMGEITPMPFPFKEIPSYVKMAYDMFGAHRMMWGSDWPPVARREGYRNALQFTREQMNFCSAEDIDWMFGKTALSVWKF